MPIRSRCTLVCIIAASMASAPTGAEAAGIVLAPTAGARLPAQPVTLRVRAPLGDRLAVRLNGVSIGSDFSPRRSGVRSLKVGASHGLRHGVNVLRATLRPRRGKARSSVVRFRVKDDRPLAGAGRDIRVPVGTSIRLDGTRSRPHPPAGLRAKLRYRWKLAGTPKPGRARAAGSDADADFAGQSSGAPSLTSDVPGSYQVRLTVTGPDGTLGSDLMSVTYDPPPALFVDTMAKDDQGRPGIKVGDAVYPADPGAYLQLVVFDRSNGPLDTTRLTSKSFPNAQAVRSFLAGIDSTNLVIASNQPENGGTSGAPVGAAAALQPALPVPSDPPPAGAGALVRGTYSAIGARGSGATVASTGASNVAGAGRMTGYLIRNNRLRYSFASADRVPADTQAAGSDATQHVMTLGATKFTAPMGASAGGFHVVIVDDRTLQGTSTWYATGQATGAAAVSVVNRMRDALLLANNTGHRLVFITSRGTRRSPSARTTACPAATTSTTACATSRRPSSWSAGPAAGSSRRSTRPSTSAPPTRSPATRRRAPASARRSSAPAPRRRRAR